MQVFRTTAFAERVKGCYRRTLTRRLGCRHYSLRLRDPLISFSFDDFPISSLAIGGDILESYGVAGTYYASLGLMGADTPTGRIFAPADLERLILCGHELGCHTYSHCDAWDTPPRVFEQSVIQNKRALAAILPGAKFETLSYPISCARPQTKQIMSAYFACCRNGGQSYNYGRTDLNNLGAFFLEQSRDNFQAIRQTIEDNDANHGWLIFATHDVCDRPTPFGCSSGFFEAVVKYAVQSKARILPVFRAWQAILGTANETISACKQHLA
jgi:peptidoglycan/xylan/chitin deacetylase (PgdA/CDA1 family)